MAETLNKSQIIEEMMSNRVDGVSKAQVRHVLQAFQDEVTECLTMGYTVTLPGFLKIAPSYVPAKPKRKGINPFKPEDGEQWLPAKPAKFRVKATASSALSKVFPGVNSKAGKELADNLTPKTKKAGKK